MKGILKVLIISLLLPAFLTSAWAQEVVTEEDDTKAIVEKPDEVTTEGLTGEEEVEVAKEETPVPQPSFGVSPKLMVKPIGTDYDFGNQAAWFALEPGVAMNAEIPTGTGKMLSLSAGYDFIYRQYLDNDKEVKFEHDISLGISHSFSDNLTLSIPGAFYIFQYYRYSHQGANEFDFETWPALQYKISEKVGMKLGIYNLFLFAPNGLVYWDQAGSLSNPPTDPGEIVKGLSDYTSSGLGYSTYQSFGLTPGDIGGDPFKLAFLGPYAEVNYSITATTSATVRYRFYAHTWTNSDTNKFMGHEVYFILGQDVWKGGSATIIYRPRYRTFNYAFTDLGNKKADWRHRFYVMFYQVINDYVGIDFYYRAEQTSSNAADSKLAHEFHIGVNLSF